MGLYRHIICSTLLVSLSSAVIADDSTLWKNCPASDYFSSSHTQPPEFIASDNDKTIITADKTKTSSGDSSLFEGNVIIEKDGLRLKADQVTLFGKDQRLKLDGNVQINGEGYTIFASSGEMHPPDIQGAKQGDLNKTSYLLPDAHLRGISPHVTLDTDNESTFDKASITSCSPGKEDWQIKTDTLWIDHKDMTASAKNVVLEFGNIPIFYTPYIIFPIGTQRRSGFLIPGIGSSSSRGTEFSIPYYWNIAPDQDATITPRYMRRRGTQINTKYRYLTSSSTGEMNAEYLGNDAVRNEERYFVRFENESTVTTHTHLSILANEISDGNYLKDLEGTLATSSTSHLENRAHLQYAVNDWNASLFLHHFDTLDTNISETDRPYRKLPQININYDIEHDGTGIQFSIGAEGTLFKHEAINKEQGYRFDLQPSINFPMGSNWWFVTPQFKYWVTEYDLEDGNNQPIDIMTRSVPVASLDMGLYFDREVNNSSLLQTLEPRLYYLRKPFKDQSNIPLFDSSEPDFTFTQLFTDNRFNGKDRVGDANQLTLSLNSRYIDQASGNELLNASIGQIIYFEDRQITLGNPVDTTTRSNLVGEISGTWNNLNASAGLQWNPRRSEADFRSVQLSYLEDNDHILNAGYRYRRDLVNPNDDFEQTELSARMAITSRIAAVGRWTYSLTDKRDVASLFGIEYDTCCWATRLVVQKYLVDSTRNSPYDTSVMFQLVFKGLGSLANSNVDEVLEHGILGYHSEY